MPSASVLANTLPASSSFTTVAGQLTYFRDLTIWPTTGGKITLALDLSLQNAGATVFLVEMGNQHIAVNVTTTGLIRLGLNDSAGTALISSATVGTMAWGVRKDLIVAVDLVARNCWVTIDGVTATYPLAANSGNLASNNRRLRFLSREITTGGYCIGTIYKAEVWADCVTGGGRPPSDTNLRANGRITGPAAIANTHPWKNGGAVT